MGNEYIQSTYLHITAGFDDNVGIIALGRAGAIVRLQMGIHITSHQISFTWKTVFSLNSN